MNKNHPAFPQHPESEIDSGLTKREIIACMAMQSIISSSDEVVFECLYARNRVYEGREENLIAEITAKAAVIYADALLKELEVSSVHTG